MHFTLVVLAILPAVFAGFTPFNQADLKVHSVGTETISSKRLSSVVTFRCRTGQNEDGFEVTISPNDGATVSESKISGKVEVTGAQVDADTVITGSMKDHLNAERSNGRCEGGNRENECSYVYRGVVTFKQEKLVPGAVSPLAWISGFRVNVECSLSPEDPRGDDTVNNVVAVPLGECEEFHHQLQISPATQRDSSVVTVSFTSPIARSGYGYKLTKCMLSLPGASPAVSLVLNGKTQKNSRFEVSGRSTDGGAGEAYQLNLKGIAFSEIVGGNLECEVERCRSAVVGSHNVAQCVRGTLLTDFVAASGRGSSIPVVNPTAKVPLSGSVKLYISQSGAARSNALQLRECMGLPALPRLA